MVIEPSGVLEIVWICVNALTERVHKRKDKAKAFNLVEV
jgi:hypothetical protein